MAVWTLAGANLLLSTVTEQASALYFAVYPLLWAVHRTRATGIMSTVVFSAGMAVAMTIRTGLWADALAVGGVSCLFSTAIGLWIWRLYEISEALKESLAAEQAARRELAWTQDELA
ncbi:MAG: sensor histidine kinase, partial [Actinomyces sp.]|nr:sensor histidine kinase [Actinomyces sp.]